jgi:ABC-2 type transport system ATP-binding protein
LIEVRNLTKRYGQVYAVNDVSFTVDDGEILGFLGPNGAGKTTTMNIITGYLAATSGDVIINGVDIQAEPEKAKRSIGYLPDTPPLYGDMKVAEYLKFVADIKKVRPSIRAGMIEEIMDIVKVSEKRSQLIRTLSKGYKQRVGLAQAMMGYPEAIIMDEPTVGLDPKQIIEMRDVIKNLGKKHTVLLSSHILHEVSAVCDRVMIISKGKIEASDTPERLSSNITHGRKMSVRVKGESSKILDVFQQTPLLKNVKAEGSREPGTVEILVSGDDGVDIREAVFYCCAKASLPILQMNSQDLTLEEIFLQITSEGGAEQ